MSTSARYQGPRRRSPSLAVWHLGASFVAPDGRLCRWSAAGLGAFGCVVVVLAFAWEGGAPGTGALLAALGGLAAAWPLMAPVARGLHTPPNELAPVRVER
jgi:hypothetical protein